MHEADCSLKLLCILSFAIIYQLIPRYINAIPPPPKCHPHLFNVSDSKWLWPTSPRSISIFLLQFYDDIRDFICLIWKATGTVNHTPIPYVWMAAAHLLLTFQLIFQHILHIHMGCIDKLKKRPITLGFFRLSICHLI